MLLLLALVVLAALAAQLAALWRMGEREPIGDEVEYLTRGRADDPQAPGFFLRPPLLPWLASLCLGGREAGAGASRLRQLMAVASVLTVALTAVAGWRLGGPVLAVLAALLLTAQPERILLGCHLWPDTLLAASLAALAVIQTLPAEPTSALAAGGVVTVGVLTRIDFLAALPLLLAAWGDGPLTAASAAGLACPPLLALSALSIRNGRRYGMPYPDNTWAFNLIATRSEMMLGGQDRVGIEGVIADAAAKWQDMTPREVPRRALAALWDALHSPWLLGQGIARRLLTLVGPDTFIRQKLLARGAAYPALGERPRRLWGTALSAAFPLLVTLVLSMAAVGWPTPASFAWPSLGLLSSAVLFCARTRYRLAAMPAFSLLAAQALVLHGETLAGRPLAAVAGLVGGLLFLCGLLRIRCSAELY